jgi:hypothetical protein
VRRFAESGRDRAIGRYQGESWMRTTVWAVMAAFVAVAPSAVAQTKPTADTQELAAYRLSMATVNKVAAANRAMVTELKKDPRFQEMAKLDAEIKALRKKEDTTEAEDARLEKLEARKEELSDTMNDLSFANAETLTDMEAQIRKSPRLMAGLTAANLTPREYAKFMLSALQAGMVAGLKKQGVIKEVPKDIPAENVAFMEQHEAELKALQEAWKSGGDEK